MDSNFKKNIPSILETLTKVSKINRIPLLSVCNSTAQLHFECCVQVGLVISQMHTMKLEKVNRIIRRQEQLTGVKSLHLRLFGLGNRYGRTRYRCIKLQIVWGKWTCLVLVDLVRAFDTLDHCILLIHLGWFGF